LTRNVTIRSHLALALLILSSCVARKLALPPASTSPNAPPQALSLAAGGTLFLKNCAHCHGADARGGEGPDLHNLAWTDEQIETRIRNGKKGQMTAFSGKLSPAEIKLLVSYIQTDGAK
jgi:mono/diheme cytochrome c family protein